MCEKKIIFFAFEQNEGIVDSICPELQFEKDVMKYPLTDLLIRPSRLPRNAYIKGHKAYSSLRDKAILSEKQH